MNTEVQADWPARLLRWFGAHRRPMPWRDRPTPYRIWISEIMLQQTRVETVGPYFQRFLEHFPTPRALAGAPLEAVLRQWQGLGYYARARNLHRAARSLHATDFRLPQTAAEWLQLPGVGDYTAAAIASIGHQEPVPLVDGNVARLFIRLLALRAPARDAAARRRIRAVLAPVVARVQRPGDFNQALMELGALICVPRNPRCAQCPLPPDCRAFARGRQQVLPLRAVPVPRAERHAVGAILRRNGRMLLVRQAPDRLLGGLWALPGGSFDPTVESAGDALTRHLRADLGLSTQQIRPEGCVRHDFTHFRLWLHVLQITARGRVRAGSDRAWTPIAGLEQRPMARLYRKALASYVQPQTS